MLRRIEATRKCTRAHQDDARPREFSWIILEGYGVDVVIIFARCGAPVSRLFSTSRPQNVRVTGSSPVLRGRPHEASRTMSPEQRARISADTKIRMADPTVRERISKRTKEGLLAAAGGLRELRDLRIAWKYARPTVRKLFLDEVLTPLYATNASNGTTSKEGCPPVGTPRTPAADQAANLPLERCPPVGTLKVLT